MENQNTITPINAPNVGVAAYTVQQICKRNNCGPTFAYGEMKLGKLKYMMFGGHRRITPAMEHDWHEVCRAAAEAAIEAA